MFNTIFDVLKKIDFFLGRLFFGKRKAMASHFGIKDNLSMRHFRDGKVIGERSLGHNLVVDDGLEYIVDCWQNSVEMETMKYHDTGEGVTGAAAGNSAMESATGFTRATGSTTETSAKVFKSVGTVSCTGTKAITEWGIFSASTGGVLGARNTFSAINVVNGDSCEFTWEATLSAS